MHGQKATVQTLKLPLSEKFYLIANQFWEGQPALLYGISCWLGCLGKEHIANLLLLFSALLVLFRWIKPVYSSHQLLLRIVFAALCSLLFAHYARSASTPLPENFTHEKGTALFHIQSIKQTTTPFDQRYVFQGVILQWIPESPNNANPAPRNLKTSLYLPLKIDSRPQASCDYWIKGTLKKGMKGSPSLQPEKKEPWMPVLRTSSLAELRYQAKKKLSASINASYTDPSCKSFLSGIATGDFDDRLLQYQFSRFGLQHIMAISGFHFSVTASVFFLLFSLFCCKRTSCYLLTCLLTLYFIFIGPQLSVLRAFTMSLIAILGFILGRKSSSLNSFGCALIFVLLIDPEGCESLGFQFSFATTASILLLYPVAEDLLQKVFLKRRLNEAIQMPRSDKAGYILLAFFRQALALSLAVNITALPITLYHFHKFPWMGLAFNLFFPFLASFSLCLLMVGLGLTLLFPPLGKAIHALNDLYTAELLRFTFQIPVSFDFFFRVALFPQPLLAAILVVAFMGGVYFRHRLREKRELAADWTFI